jgi:hypothetical protein
VTEPKYLNLIAGWRLRIGRAHEYFSERHQGQYNIPKRFHYLLGKRVTLISPRAYPSQKEDS